MLPDFMIEKIEPDWKMLFGALAAKVSAAANCGHPDVRNKLISEAEKIVDAVYSSPLYIKKEDD